MGNIIGRGRYAGETYPRSTHEALSTPKVKVGVTDTAAGFLNEKLTGVGGIALDVLNPGGDEQVRIDGSAIEALVPLPDHSLEATTGTPNPILKIKSFIDLTDRPYLAVSSSQTTTGSINSGLTALTLAAAIDFQDGQGIVVHGAGSAHGLSAPAAPVAVRFGASGSTIWDYKVVAITSEDGASASSAASNQIVDAPATLTASNFIRVSITPVPGAHKYLVYGRKNNTGAGWSYHGACIANPLLDQRGHQPLVYFNDTTGNFIPPRKPFVNTAPASAASNLLRTRIISGGGSTSLVLADVARTTVSAKTVEHDNLQAFKDAIVACGADKGDSSGGNIFIPRGQSFRICGDLHIDRAMHIEGAGGEGQYPATVLVFSDGFGIQLDGPRTGPAWTPGKPFALGERCEPVVLNGHIYECTTVGITGTTYPTFPTTNGNTLADGAVTWTCRGATLRQAAWSVIEDLQLYWTAKTIPIGRVVAHRDPDDIDYPNISAVTRYGGTTGPAVTTTNDGYEGDSTKFLTIQIEITTGGTVASGNARFKWSKNGGLTFTTGITVASSVLLTGTGITLAFAAGTCAVGEGYNVRGADVWPGAGLTMRVRARTYRVSTFGCPGSAIVIYGDENAYSNANTASVHGGYHQNAEGWAVYTEGGDANSCSIDTLDCAGCKGGYGDNSFLGCRWSCCSCSGGVTVSPTFANRTTGCHADWHHCNSEGGQSNAFIRNPATWFGGYPASPIDNSSSGLIFPGATSVRAFEVHNALSSIDVWLTLAARSTTSYVFGLHNSDGNTDHNAWLWQYNSTQKRWTADVSGSGTYRTFSICIDETRGSGLIAYNRGFLMGTYSAEKRLDADVAVPTTDDIWDVGDFIFDISTGLRRLGWRPTAACGIGPAWIAANTVRIGQTVKRVAGTEDGVAGSVYVCTAVTGDAQTGATEPGTGGNPHWPALAGTVTDGNVTWTNWGGGTVAMQTVAHPSQAKGADLSDGDETVDPQDGTWRVLVSRSGNRTKTLGTTGALTGDQITITVLDKANNTAAIANGGPGAGTLYTIPALNAGYVKAQFDGTNWLLREVGTGL